MLYIDPGSCQRKKILCMILKETGIMLQIFVTIVDNFCLIDFYLDDTHHRVVILRGTDKTIVCEEELTTTRGTGKGPEPRRIPILASRA